MTDFVATVFFIVNAGLFVAVFAPVLFGITDRFKSVIYVVGLLLSVSEIIGGTIALILEHTIYGGVFFQAIFYLVFAAYLEFADWKEDKKIHVLYR